MTDHPTHLACRTGETVRLEWRPASYADHRAAELSPAAIWTLPQLVANVQGSAPIALDGRYYAVEAGGELYRVDARVERGDGR